MQFLICPICRETVYLPNRLVRFHIGYKDNDYIMACQHCNTVEYFLRTGYSFKVLEKEYSRRETVVKLFMQKYAKK